MVTHKKLSLSVCIISALNLVACSGEDVNGGASQHKSVASTLSANEKPIVSSTPIADYTTSIEQNLSIFNEQNKGATVQFTPAQRTTKSVVEPSYRVSHSNNSKVSFYYRFDSNKEIFVDYDKLTGKVVQAKIEKDKSTFYCGNGEATNTDCNGINVIYDDRTGNSTVSFNKQQLEVSYEDAPYSIGDGPYQITVNGTLKGNISRQPLAFTDFEKTHHGNVTVNGKKMDIFRAYMRDNQLVVQFTNGESLYLLTGKSSVFINTYDTREEYLSTPEMATLKHLDNDRVNVKFNNINFVSDDYGTGSKVVSGDITLIRSSAKIDIPNVEKIDTNEVYVEELSNKETTYLITTATGNGYITVQGQNPVKIDINGYSCTLDACKNVAVSKDGTYIKLNGTLLSGVPVTGSIRTNIH